jgi:hypothetical protein
MNIPDRGGKAQRTITLTPPPSNEDEKKHTVAPTSFFLDILFIQGRLESSPISDDEPTVLGEEPPQLDARRRSHDIMKPENGIWLNPSHETKPQRWGRPLMKEHTENDLTLIVVTIIKLKNASGS